jgi:hypothetical protein
LGIPKTNISSSLNENENEKDDPHTETTVANSITTAARVKLHATVKVA